MKEVKVDVIEVLSIPVQQKNTEGVLILHVLHMERLRAQHLVPSV